MISIYAQKLSRAFGKRLAIDNISFRLQGDKIAVLGANGSGKTTLLFMLTGLLKPTSGTLTFDGINPYKQRNIITNEASFIFEKSGLPDRWKVRDIVSFSERRGLAESESEESPLRRELSKYENKRVNELSSGEEQFLNLYLALTSKARIAVLDEPINHLDAFRSGIVLEYMSGVKKSVIFTTHVPEDAEAVADTFLILNEGKLKWLGKAIDLYSEGEFEVFSSRKKIDGLSIAHSYGYIKLVMSDKETLQRLLKDELIDGYRKGGLRWLYYENK